MKLLKSIAQALCGTKNDFWQMIRDGALVLDVRRACEFRREHYKNSINIPLRQLSERIEELRDRRIIIVCRSGKRALQAQVLLERSGIPAMNAGAWQTLIEEK